MKTISVRLDDRTEEFVNAIIRLKREQFNQKMSINAVVCQALYTMYTDTLNEVLIKEGGIYEENEHKEINLQGLCECEETEK